MCNPKSATTSYMFHSPSKPMACHHFKDTLDSFSINIPHENYAGIVLPGEERTYVIISRFAEDGDLLVYHIKNIDVDGEHCEAQVFQKRYLPIKLYLARKRRFHRLMRSNNLIEEFEFNDAIVLVSRIPEEGLERHRHYQLAKESKGWYGFSEEQFPPLPSLEGHHLKIHLRDSQLECIHQSYAEAASSRQRIYASRPVEYSPETTNEGTFEQAWYEFSEEQFPSLPSPDGHRPDSPWQNIQTDHKCSSYAKAASLPRKMSSNYPAEYLSETKDNINRREPRRCRSY